MGLLTFFSPFISRDFFHTRTHRVFETRTQQAFIPVQLVTVANLAQGITGPLDASRKAFLALPSLSSREESDAID